MRRVLAEPALELRRGLRRQVLAEVGHAEVVARGRRLHERRPALGQQGQLARAERPHHAVVGGGGVAVQALRRRELERQPVVGVEVGAEREPGRVRLGQQEVGEERPRRAEAEAEEVLAQRGRRRPRGLHAREVERPRLARADQDEVGGAVRVPHRGRGERGAEGLDDHLQILGADRVAVDPLHHHPARRQPRARQRVELLREERGHAADPRVGRLGDDDVPPAIAGQQVVARVADGQVDLRVAQHLAALAPEELRGLDHRRLDLDHVHALRPGAVATAPAVTPLPRPITSVERASGCSSIGRWPSISCMCMSSAVARVRLAVDAQERGRPLAVHAHGGRQPVAVEEELAALGRAREARRAR